jgi:hypothetical protein
LVTKIEHRMGAISMLYGGKVHVKSFLEAIHTATRWHSSQRAEGIVGPLVMVVNTDLQVNSNGLGHWVVVLLQGNGVPANPPARPQVALEQPQPNPQHHTRLHKRGTLQAAFANLRPATSTAAKVTSTAVTATSTAVTATKAATPAPVPKTATTADKLTPTPNHTINATQPAAYDGPERKKVTGVVAYQRYGTPNDTQKKWGATHTWLRLYSSEHGTLQGWCKYCDKYKHLAPNDSFKKSKEFDKGIRPDYLLKHKGAHAAAEAQWKLEHGVDDNEHCHINSSDLRSLIAQEDEMVKVIINVCYTVVAEQMAFTKVARILDLLRTSNAPLVPSSHDNVHSVEEFVVAISDVILELHHDETRGKIKGLMSDGASNVKEREMECTGTRHLHRPTDCSPCEVQTRFAGIGAILIEDSADGRSFDASAIMGVFHKIHGAAYGDKWWEEFVAGSFDGASVMLGKYNGVHLPSPVAIV